MVTAGAAPGYPPWVLTPRRWAVVRVVACATGLLLAAGVPASAATGAAARATAGDDVAARAAAAAGSDVVGGPELASPGIVVHRQAGATKLPSVQADTWLLADLTTGEVLAAKGAHTRVYPASTLKTLTAVTLMPKLDRNMVWTATYDEARADGGHVGIVPGATYTVWDLWHGLLLPSANDAAAALADANGGMVHTVREMRAMAAHLHADDTVVSNDSGLDAPHQRSSAYDMALMARAALAIPDFRTVTRTISYDFPGRPVKPGQKRHTYKIYGQNRLLIHGYPGTIGGKTGFTSIAHRTFWGAARRDGHTLVVTLFQIHEPTESAARSLLDWGFANLGKLRPVGTLVEPGDPPATTTSSPVAAAPGVAAAAASTTAAVAASGTSPVMVATVVAVVVVLLLGVLWLRRWSRDDGSARPEPPAEGPAPGTTGAPAASAHRVEQPAAPTGTGVRVQRPPSRPAPAGAAPAPPAAQPEPAGASGPLAEGSASASDETGPVPLVGGIEVPPAGTTPAAAAPAGQDDVEEPPAPPRARPAARVDEAAHDREEGPGEQQRTEPRAPGRTPSPQRPPSSGAGGSSGNVRVIRPPQRPES